MPYFLRSKAKPCPSKAKDLKSYTKIVPIVIRPGLTVNFRVLLEKAFAEHEESFQEGELDTLSSQPLMDVVHCQPATSPSTSQAQAPSHAQQAVPIWIERSLSTLMAQHPVGGEAADTMPLSRSHRRRKRKRNAEILENGHVPRPAVKKILVDICQPIPTTLNTADLPTTSCGYLAKNSDEDFSGSAMMDSGENENLDKLLKNGYTYVEWNGCDPRPILDNERRVIGVLAGKPCGKDYDLAANRVFEKFVSLGKLPEMQQASKSNRRGNFPALNFGVTHGKGITAPVNLHGPKKGKPSEYAHIVEDLLSDEDLRMLATFGSYSFATWAPDVYTYYRTNLSRLWEKEPHLRQNFPKSVFPSAAMNAGPNAWTCRHKDLMNCSFGMCSIQSLGKFDHTKGGHLVLPDLELVIEFPANSTILIPSATLIHANVPVQSGEQRASFTQYCAGGLFRYIDCHFMTEKRLEVVDPVEYQRLQALKTSRWKMGLSLLSSFDDLVDEIQDI